MIIDGFEDNPDLCVWGDWEEINGETHEWIRHCTTCSSYQSTTRDPSLPPEFVLSKTEANDTNTGPVVKEEA